MTIDQFKAILKKLGTNSWATAYTIFVELAQEPILETKDYYYCKYKTKEMRFWKKFHRVTFTKKQTNHG
jgi:hypothetical protein